MSDPAQLPVLQRVFAAVFGGLVDDARRGDPAAPPLVADPYQPDRRSSGGEAVAGDAGGGAPRPGQQGGRADGTTREMAVAAVGVGGGAPRRP